MSRTKAEFRFTRETVGMTQAFLARELDVEVRSVKRWESPDAPQSPPKDAWDILDSALELQRQVISFSLGKVDEIAQQQGNYPASVKLPYWSSQEEYECWHCVNDEGDFRAANANLRLLAFALHERDIKVEWVAGKDLPTAQVLGSD